MYVLIFHRSVEAGTASAAVIPQSVILHTMKYISTTGGEREDWVSGIADNHLYCSVPVQCCQLPFFCVWYEGPRECIAIWGKILTLAYQYSQTLGFAKFILSVL